MHFTFGWASPCFHVGCHNCVFVSGKFAAKIFNWSWSVYLTLEWKIELKLPILYPVAQYDLWFTAYPSCDQFSATILWSDLTITVQNAPHSATDQWSREKLFYLQVRANPPIRFAEWINDKNLYFTANITTMHLVCSMVTHQVCLKINMLSLALVW